MMTIYSVVNALVPKTVQKRTQNVREPQSRLHTKEKLDGIHYTPPDLAAFLAEQVAKPLRKIENANQLINVLDPACGDGELLRAFAEAMGRGLRTRLVLHGFDKDERAL